MDAKQAAHIAAQEPKAAAAAAAVEAAAAEAGDAPKAASRHLAVGVNETGGWPSQQTTARSADLGEHADLKPAASVDGVGAPALPNLGTPPQTPHSYTANTEFYHTPGRNSSLVAGEEAQVYTEQSSAAAGALAGGSGSLSSAMAGQGADPGLSERKLGNGLGNETAEGIQQSNRFATREGAGTGSSQVLGTVGGAAGSLDDGQQAASEAEPMSERSGSWLGWLGLSKAAGAAGHGTGAQDQKSLLTSQADKGLAGLPGGEGILPGSREATPRRTEDVSTAVNSPG
jgi:hypothetical protein